MSFPVSDLRTLVTEVVTSVAPELDAGELDGTARLQEDLGLDSMDRLDVVTELADRLGIDIPERAYDRLTTIDATVAYLEDLAAATP